MFSRNINCITKLLNKYFAIGSKALVKAFIVDKIKAEINSKSLFLHEKSILGQSSILRKKKFSDVTPHTYSPFTTTIMRDRPMHRPTYTWRLEMPEPGIAT